MSAARKDRRNKSIAFGGALLLLICALALMSGGVGLSSQAVASDVGSSTHLGVASCAGSTCHGRMEADGRIVRQDELMRWQEPSTPGGAHSRAFAVLSNARSAQIARNLGIGSASAAPMCLGCHSDAATSRGPLFQIGDGVGCESCHGGSTGWIASHYTVGASHAANVARGMIPLDNPKARASVCLDCHFGSAEDGQFVNHRIMAAGHPRISFELDLFSTLQQHHNEDADYTARKGRTDNVRMWAVGQAMAVSRSLALYTNPQRGTEGVFPEFYFFDCHSCHRQIFDQAQPVKTVVANPGRPIPSGMPPYNDENMIMLSAAAKVAAPGLAAQFDASSRNFHAAYARDRGTAIAAAKRLAASADALATALSSRSFGSEKAFAMIDVIAGAAISPRYTDYEGSVQAVMAIDTLLNALVNSGKVTVGAAAGIRANINRAYAAVHEPNDYRPLEFRAALGEAARSIRALS
jgi:Cytochrome c554 and c-prime